MTWKKQVLPEIFEGQIQPTIHLSHEEPQYGLYSAVFFKKVVSFGPTRVSSLKKLLNILVCPVGLRLILMCLPDKTV